MFLCQNEHEAKESIFEKKNVLLQGITHWISKNHESTILLKKKITVCWKAQYDIEHEVIYIHFKQIFQNTM